MQRWVGLHSTCARCNNFGGAAYVPGYQGRYRGDVPRHRAVGPAAGETGETAVPEQLRMTVKHAYPGASSWSWPVAWLSSIGTVEQPHQHIFGVGSAASSSWTRRAASVCTTVAGHCRHRRQKPGRRSDRSTNADDGNRGPRRGAVMRL